METSAFGRLLEGDPEEVSRSYDLWQRQPVDQEFTEQQPCDASQTTIAQPFAVTGGGTFLGHQRRTVSFEPAPGGGWRFDRRDIPEAVPMPASVDSVWTTGIAVRNIVLRSGPTHNYIRMVEHILALKVGLALDHVLVRMDSGDPPLFDRSSRVMFDSVEQAGTRSLDRPAKWVTVREPVTVGGPKGSFLTFLPAAAGERRLLIDCAVDFPNAIGRQRIRFPVSRAAFAYGSVARTNTSFAKMLFCMTLGKLFADIRNLGYTRRNILIAGRWRYLNEPRLRHHGKSLEAAWHRGALDLPAAIALIDRGRLAGTVLSYKAGHALDVLMIRKLYQEDLLERLEQGGRGPQPKGRMLRD